MADSINKFVSTAQQYCSWAEGHSLAPEKDIKNAISFVSSLYSRALKLTVVGCGGDINGENITHEEWELICNRFKTLPFRYYSVSFSPAKIEDTPVIGDVADDLADIYRDLKSGLWLYEKGYVTEAIWEWKHSFNAHWGRHAVSLLHALHCYTSDEYIEL